MQQLCNRCGSLGILHLRAIGEPQEALVFCTCSWSRMQIQIWKLPRVNSAIENAFDVRRCPLEWFRPSKAKARVAQGRIIPDIAPNVEAWRGRLKKAEHFWREYGPLFDRSWQDDDGGAA